MSHPAQADGDSFRSELIKRFFNTQSYFFYSLSSCLENASGIVADITESDYSLIGQIIQRFIDDDEPEVTLDRISAIPRFGDFMKGLDLGLVELKRPGLAEKEMKHIVETMARNMVEVIVDVIHDDESSNKLLQIISPPASYNLDESPASLLGNDLKDADIGASYRNKQQVPMPAEAKRSTGDGKSDVERASILEINDTDFSLEAIAIADEFLPEYNESEILDLPENDSSEASDGIKNVEDAMFEKRMQAEETQDDKEKFDSDLTSVLGTELNQESSPDNISATKDRQFLEKVRPDASLSEPLAHGDDWENALFEAASRQEDSEPPTVGSVENKGASTGEIQIDFDESESTFDLQSVDLKNDPITGLEEMLPAQPETEILPASRPQATDIEENPVSSLEEMLPAQPETEILPPALPQPIDLKESPVSSLEEMLPAQPETEILPPALPQSFDLKESPVSSLEEMLPSQPEDEVQKNSSQFTPDEPETSALVLTAAKLDAFKKNFVKRLTENQDGDLAQPFALSNAFCHEINTLVSNAQKECSVLESQPESWSSIKKIRQAWVDIRESCMIHGFEDLETLSHKLQMVLDKIMKECVKIGEEELLLVKDALAVSYLCLAEEIDRTSRVYLASVLDGAGRLVSSLENFHYQGLVKPDPASRETDASKQSPTRNDKDNIRSQSDMIEYVDEGDDDGEFHLPGENDPEFTHLTDAERPGLNVKKMVEPEASELNSREHESMPVQAPTVISPDMGEDLLTAYHRDAGSYFGIIDDAVLKILGDGTDMVALEKLELASYSLKGVAQRLGLQEFASFPKLVEELAGLILMMRLPLSKLPLKTIVTGFRILRNTADTGDVENDEYHESIQEMAGVIQGLGEGQPVINPRQSEV